MRCIRWGCPKSYAGCIGVPVAKKSGTRKVLAHGIHKVFSLLFLSANVWAAPQPLVQVEEIGGVSYAVAYTEREVGGERQVQRRVYARWEAGTRQWKMLPKQAPAPTPTLSQATGRTTARFCFSDRTSPRRSSSASVPVHMSLPRTSPQTRGDRQLDGPHAKRIRCGAPLAARRSR